MYNPYEKTAIKRKSLSVPMRELMNLGLLDNKKILDFGCGRGDCLNFLSYLGLDISGYDKYNQLYASEELLEEKYDVVTCNYVFNVIPKQEHDELLDQLKGLGKEIYIAVRADSKAIKDNWIYIEEFDCWKTPKGSYQRFYDEEMIEKYFGCVEYLINNKSCKLIKLKGE